MTDMLVRTHAKKRPLVRQELGCFFVVRYLLFQVLLAGEQDASS
jgi:hypothetical protein